jgi:prepilin-type N-terminal cleavage/methylation domain-containing protein
MKMRSHSFPEAGFSLVELSVVLVIMSVVLGSVLSLATTKSKEAKLKETQEIMKKVSEALAAYVAENNRIPCPSNGSVSQNNIAFGKEVEDCSVNPGGVPTKTLEIADDYAYDAWRRRITYYIAPPCSDNDSFIDSSLCPSASGITVKSAAASAITSTAVYVMVSHGQNGYGAWSHNGGKKKIATTAASPEELENANGDKIFVQRTVTATFDDVVAYGTRALLIQQAGGLVGMGGAVSPPVNISPLCAMVASRVRDNNSAIQMCGTGNTDCSDALWSSSGKGVAAQVAALCY